LQDYKLSDSNEKFEELRHQGWKKNLTLKNLFKNIVLLVIIIYVIIKFYQ